MNGQLSASVCLKERELCRLLVPYCLWSLMHQSKIIGGGVMVLMATHTHTHTHTHTNTRSTHTYTHIHTHTSLPQCHHMLQHILKCHAQSNKRLINICGYQHQLSNLMAVLLPLRF